MLASEDLEDLEGDKLMLKPSLRGSELSLLSLRASEFPFLSLKDLMQGHERRSSAEGRLRGST